MTFVAAVLTGGASTRMGTDKALLEVDGQPMAQRVANALTAAGANAVRCLGGDVAALSALGLDAHSDSVPGEGPLAAIADALAWADGKPVVIAPCDLLDPQPDDFAALAVAARDQPDADVVLVTVDGRDQYVVGLWRATATTAVHDAYAAGERSVRSALAGVSVYHWPGPEALGRDADTPEDLLPR